MDKILFFAIAICAFAICTDGNIMRWDYQEPEVEYEPVPVQIYMMVPKRRSSSYAGPYSPYAQAQINRYQNQMRPFDWGQVRPQQVVRRPAVRPSMHKIVSGNRRHRIFGGWNSWNSGHHHNHNHGWGGWQGWSGFPGNGGGFGGYAFGPHGHGQFFGYGWRGFGGYRRRGGWGGWE